MAYESKGRSLVWFEKVHAAFDYTRTPRVLGDDSHHSPKNAQAVFGVDINLAADYFHFAAKNCGISSGVGVKSKS